MQDFFIHLFRAFLFYLLSRADAAEDAVVVGAIQGRRRDAAAEGEGGREGNGRGGGGRKVEALKEQAIER